RLAVRPAWLDLRQHRSVERVSRAPARLHRDKKRCRRIPAALVQLRRVKHTFDAVRWITGNSLQQLAHLPERRRILGILYDDGGGAACGPGNRLPIGDLAL